MLYWTPEEIYAGGDFTKISNQPFAYFAGFSAAPMFLPETIQRQDNGTFLATLQTGEGTRVIVQTSKDWQSWQDLATNSVTGFPLNFVHSPDGSSPCLFYRAVLRQD